MTTTAHTTALAKLTRAAAAGDQAAQDALDSLTQTAATIDAPPLTGREQGRAEAVRRFGKVNR